jgi:KipI family sensor histidine kinase inhibitor
VLSGFYLRFGSDMDEARNRRLQGLTQSILADPHQALTDVIPGYNTLYLEYDATRLSEAELRDWLETRKETAPVAGRRHEVSVVYDGPDLAAVAERAGLGVDEVIERHSAREYYVYAVGFTPGLAFMGELDPALRLPRRDTPRARVEAGSVAIANRQTTVYPVASPGGWHLLGRTARPVYTPTAEDPLLFAAGDRVRTRASPSTPATVSILQRNRRAAGATWRWPEGSRAAPFGAARRSTCADASADLWRQVTCSGRSAPVPQGRAGCFRPGSLALRCALCPDPKLPLKRSRR